MPLILRWLYGRKGAGRGGARSGKARFAMVYIREAHASDTWPMKFSIEWPRPTTMAQRVEYALTCSDDLELPQDFPVYVDSVKTDAFDEAFHAWPTCYYVVSNQGKLLYIGECSEYSASYDVKELLRYIDTYKA